ncbi:FAD-dependent monooxygenase [Trinickia soli]|uniref:FAD-binding monooxygenase n=1 Tax=Trinickia soli TaxID=380675 RepID=A0A2N7W5N5_9BURK|nr:FAD-dependent monooxygenase [Trinickia soli]KAA0090587.1 FAD-binding monooxygenase [Paraburkholderia sp. T12-10]PMS24689.1 FAD-binding monooxygenase [Trinickia soli]CAB3652780.1 6-methylpretetramide 4-monooxygenase [Trinickia soli]
MAAVTPNALPVLIVGAGPTGLACAMSLARAHTNVRLVDRAPRPSPHSRAIGIQARTLELFEQHRVVEPFLALGHRLRAANLYSNGHRLARLDFDPLQTRYPYLLCLDQSITERLLTEHLATLGVQVERGVELVGLKQDASSVEAQLLHADGRQETCRAAYLIGADGAHSVTRHLLGMRFAGKTLEQSFLLADVQVDSDLSDDEFHLFASRDGLAAVIPMGAGRHRFIADNVEGTDHADHADSRPMLGLMSSSGATFKPGGGASSDFAGRVAEHEPRAEPAQAGGGDPPPSLDLCSAVAARRIDHPLTMSSLGWSSYFHLNSRMVERLRTQRVFLAGDAAHVHSPAGAQGMNTGIQEALNLGWKLARCVAGEAGEPLIDTYQLERHPIERDVLRQTAFITQLAEAERGPMKLLRERVMPVLAAFGPLRDAARLMVSELAIQYRRSPLTLERVLDGGPRAGERAPDALVHVVDGPLGRAPGTGRLYDLHDPGLFSLFVLVSLPAGTEAMLDATGTLVLPPVEADPELDRLISSVERTLRGVVRIWRVTDASEGEAPSLLHAYGRTRPAFYLVRPDGYICARGRPASDASALARHCETWFGGGTGAP